MVPKLIHQLWCGPKPPPLRWMDQWEMMPGFEYRLWTEDDFDQGPWKDNRAFRHFLKRRAWPGLKDVLEAHVLHEHGGIFADADSIPLRDWIDAPFLRSSGFAAKTEPHPGEPDRLGASIVGAVPGSPVMWRWAQAMHQLKRFDPSWKTTVPLLAASARIDPDFLILPQGTFYPVGLRGGRDASVEPWAEHYWGTTRGLYG